MAVRAGRMRKRMKVFKNAVDDDGELLRDDFGAISGELTQVAYPWCSVRVISDNESVGTVNRGQTRIEFTIRYSKSLENPTSDMFIEYKDKKFDIISAINDYEMNEKLIITAEARNQ